MLQKRREKGTQFPASVPSPSCLRRNDPSYPSRYTFDRIVCAWTGGSRDPHRVAALRDYLRSRSGPRAALVSTHQIDFVMTLATRFILLREGRLVADGSLPELRATLDMPGAALEEIVLRHA